MSLAIDVDKVSDVLLADGWHRVKFVNGESTFELDAYEYIRQHEGRDPDIRLGGGTCAGVPSTGATWLDADLNKQISCPLTSVLAVTFSNADEEPSMDDLAVGGRKLPEPDL